MWPAQRPARANQPGRSSHGEQSETASIREATRKAEEERARRHALEAGEEGAGGASHRSVEHGSSELNANNRRNPQNKFQSWKRQYVRLVMSLPRTCMFGFWARCQVSVVLGGFRLCVLRTGVEDSLLYTYIY